MHDDPAHRPMERGTRDVPRAGDDAHGSIRYLPLYVANKDVKLEKHPAPTVLTLSVQRGFKVAEWCRDVIAWLRGRGLLAFFLAAVTGRAVLLTDGDDGLGVTEDVLCLDAWLRSARDRCAGGRAASVHACDQACDELSSKDVSVTFASDKEKQLTMLKRFDLWLKTMPHVAEIRAQKRLSEEQTRLSSPKKM